MTEKELIKKAREFSMVPEQRLRSTLSLAKKAVSEELEGCFVECGVFKGGAASLMAYVAAKEGERRKLWLCDSFEGVPEPSAVDGGRAAKYCGGKASGNLRSTGKMAAKPWFAKHLIFVDLGLDDYRPSVYFVKGWFQETLPANREMMGAIAVLRLDCDWYASTKLCLEQLYEQIVSGGIIIVDDYGHWEGCKQAVDEFLAGLPGRNPRLYKVGSSVWWRKAKKR